MLKYAVAIQLLAGKHPAHVCALFKTRAVFRAGIYKYKVEITCSS